MAKPINEIRALKRRIHYLDLEGNVRLGYTDDTCRRAYLDGFARVYEISTFVVNLDIPHEQRTLEYTEIPFNVDMRFHPNYKAV